MKAKTLLKFVALPVFSLMFLLATAQVDNINGQVTYHNDGVTALEGVTIYLKDSGGTLIQTTTSTANGSFGFTNIPYGTYRLSGSYNLAGGGVTMADAQLINKYRLGQIQLSPMQLLAADVNDDGSVTHQDFVMMVVHHFAQGNPFPRSWVFNEVVVELNELKSTGGTGLGGSSSGDVNGTFEPVNKTSIINFFAYKSLHEAVAGDEIVLPVFFNEPTELSAMMLVMDYPSHLVEVIDITTLFNLFDYSITSSQVRISAIDRSDKAFSFRKGEAIASLRVRLKENFTAKSEVLFNLRPESHFVNPDAVHLSPKVSVPIIKFYVPSPELYANYPNPFSSQTQVTYKLSEACHTNISVYDLQGKLVSILVNQYQTDGIYQVDFMRGNLKPGTYLCRLSTLGVHPSTETRVMIITSD
ncbi:MAG: T9SS type A sorting domain-containing protein [Bacteroidales bacterium]|nr:T9SS type A sorting domain-containing protein [Bacteroidales bacterium]